MPATVVVGCQWGDEGKGKVVDVLAAESDLVARFQGGSNAGHTVIIGDKKYVFHMLPSGVLHEGSRNLLGNGVVVDVASLVEEIEGLEKEGVDVMGRLLLSDQAHVILPFHRAHDSAGEESGRETKIGTTKRGIGLAYGDKFRRKGLRLCDFRHPDRFAARYRELSEYHDSIMKTLYGCEAPDPEEGLEQLMARRDRITALLCDGVTLVNDLLSAGKEVLCEGAQGVMLDIDHGTYPFVTSSSPTSGGACTGLGIPPTAIKRVIGIVKAYTTRVGEGPMPTELHGDEGERLRKAGGEFGATTGRPRRCGWFDAPVVRRAVQICGCTELCITKLDVLDDYETIPVCTNYDTPAGQTNVMPFDLEVTAAAKPVLEERKGWHSRTSGVTKRDDLPADAIAYLSRLETLAGAPVTIVSTGPARAATIPFAKV